MLGETWRGAPRFDRAEVTLTASARDTRESASAAFLAVPWPLAAPVCAAAPTGTLLVTVGRARARRSVPGRPSRT
ncbi:hypothetical protein ACE1SV_21170 [Streptomyces sp. E-15]